MNPAISHYQKCCIDYTACFGDVRLDARGNTIASAMLEKETVILNRLSENRPELVSSSLFFQNERVSQAILRDEATTRWAEAAQGLHVLVIQDTSEINYQHHAGKLDREDADLGPLGNHRDIGFFLHPTLVVDARDGFPLGVSDIYVWNRTWNQATKTQREYKKLPIEEKESFRWIRSAQVSRELLCESDLVTIVADREADIYEEFIEVPDAKTHLLIRSTQNRVLADQPAKLFEHLGTREVGGTYRVNIPQGHSKRQGRIAEIEVRCCPVKIARPKHTVNKTLPEYVELYAIEAKETASTLVGGEEALCWRLLTTHGVNSFADACEIIQWYQRRWMIEQLFRTLKQQGLDVEASQLETGAGLKKLVTMAVSTALRILQVTLERDDHFGRAGTIVFSEGELECLRAFQPMYEGSTVKQKNPFSVNSLAWAAWIIGRIGGWKGYRKAGPAGPVTIERGLETFNQLFTGWLLQKMYA